MILRNHHSPRPNLLLQLPPHNPLHGPLQILLHRQPQQLIIQHLPPFPFPFPFHRSSEIIFPPTIRRAHDRLSDAAPVALLQPLLSNSTLLLAGRVSDGPGSMGDGLESGEDGVLGDAEGVDEDVAVCRFGGVGEDGGGGEAGSGEEGEIRGGGAGAVDGGGLGFEVEAEEAVFEAPVYYYYY